MNINNDEIKGWLSIFASMMREDNQHIQNFIDDNKEKLNNIQWFDKARVIFLILSKCVDDISLRKCLQSNFGQFDGAQICMNCGKIMWEGYSWAGDTYCSIDCILNNENTSLSEIEDCLKDADSPDGEYYYTDWK